MVSLLPLVSPWSHSPKWCLLMCRAPPWLGKHQPVPHPGHGSGVTRASRASIIIQTSNNKYTARHWSVSRVNQKLTKSSRWREGAAPLHYGSYKLVHIFRHENDNWIARGRGVGSLLHLSILFWCDHNVSVTWSPQKSGNLQILCDSVL